MTAAVAIAVDPVRRRAVEAVRAILRDGRRGPDAINPHCQVCEGHVGSFSACPGCLGWVEPLCWAPAADRHGEFDPETGDFIPETPGAPGFDPDIGNFFGSDDAVGPPPTDTESPPAQMSVGAADFEPILTDP